MNLLKLLLSLLLLALFAFLHLWAIDGVLNLGLFPKTGIFVQLASNARVEQAATGLAGLVATTVATMFGIRLPGPKSDAPAAPVKEPRINAPLAPSSDQRKAGWTIHPWQALASLFSFKLRDLGVVIYCVAFLLIGMAAILASFFIGAPGVPANATNIVNNLSNIFFGFAVAVVGSFL